MTLTIAPIEWVRPPQQSRSQKSLERILDAAEEVVAAKGFEQASVAEIVRRARSSVGVFYARFGEKESLLRCLHDRFCNEAFATVDRVLDPDRWQGASCGEILSETLPFLVEVYRRRRGLIRVFIVRAAGDRQFSDRWATVNVHLATKLGTLLLARRSEMEHPDPATAIEMGLQIVLGTLDMLSLFDQATWIRMSFADARLPRELTRVFLSYLGIDDLGIDCVEAVGANGEICPESAAPNNS